MPMNVINGLLSSLCEAGGWRFQQTIVEITFDTSRRLAAYMACAAAGRTAMRLRAADLIIDEIQR